MKIFKPFTFKWWQGAIFKIAMISFGIILGVYWQEFFLKYIVIVTLLFIIPAIYIKFIWWRQL